MLLVQVVLLTALYDNSTHVHTTAAHTAVRCDHKRCNMRLQVQEVKVTGIGESLLPEETCNQCALASSSSVALMSVFMYTQHRQEVSS
jgi:hypothetical protein